MKTSKDKSIKFGKVVYLYQRNKYDKFHQNLRLWVYFNLVELIWIDPYFIDD